MEKTPDENRDQSPMDDLTFLGGFQPKNKPEKTGEIVIPQTKPKYQKNLNESVPPNEKKPT